MTISASKVLCYMKTQPKQPNQLAESASTPAPPAPLIPQQVNIVPSGDIFCPLNL